MNFSIDVSKFKFQYLPDYAKFLLENKLEEFVTVAIRFCREINLPMMRPLDKMSEKDLIKVFIDAEAKTLKGLSHNDVTPSIEENLKNFVNNNISDIKGEKVLDNTEIVAEDIILAFHIRRKLFSFFLYSYTRNAVEHMLIAAEVDTYTTYEHLLTAQAYLLATKELQIGKSNE